MKPNASNAYFTQRLIDTCLRENLRWSLQGGWLISYQVSC